MPTDYKSKKDKMIEFIYKKDQGRRWSMGMLRAYTYNDLLNIINSYKTESRTKKAVAKAKAIEKKSAMKPYGTKNMTFGDARYEFYSSFDHARHAYTAAEDVRKDGWKARVVEVRDDISNGGPGYAVYIRAKAPRKTK